MLRLDTKVNNYLSKLVVVEARNADWVKEQEDKHGHCIRVPLGVAADYLKQKEPHSCY